MDKKNKKNINKKLLELKSSIGIGFKGFRPSVQLTKIDKMNKRAYPSNI